MNEVDDIIKKMKKEIKQSTEAAAREGKMLRGASRSRSSSAKVELKRRTFKTDRDKLLIIQRGWCANKDCAKLNNGARQRVYTEKDIDHKIPLKIWELMSKSPKKFNDISNLQILCPRCHRNKTAEDRKNIALYKDKKKSRQETGLLGINTNW